MFLPGVAQRGVRGLSGRFNGLWRWSGALCWVPTPSPNTYTTIAYSLPFGNVPEVIEGGIFLVFSLAKLLDMIERVFYNRKALEWANPVGGPHSFLIFSALLRACNKGGRQPIAGCLPLSL